MKVDVRFFGTPEIYLDGKKVLIQQKKILSLLLYLMFNLHCTRDELASMFWCDFSEDSAKQNLRNGLYKLKGIMGEELIVTKGNTYVEISSKVDIRKDIDILIAEDGGDRLLEFSGFVFLDKFYLRNAVEFEKWIISIRAIYEKMVCDILEKRMRDSVHIGERTAERYASRLLEVSPYHEEALRILMQQYGLRGAYNEAIQLYTDFAVRLNDDLNVQPEDETQELYRSLLEWRFYRRQPGQSRLTYPAHQQSIVTISGEYGAFRTGHGYRHCIVQGDMGMGKSQVIENFLETEGNPECICLKFEAVGAEIPYYSIGKILDRLSEMYGMQQSKPNYDDPYSLKLHYIIAMDTIAAYIKAQNRQALIILENIESIDERSMQFIFSHLLDKCRGVVMVVGEYCQNFCPDRESITRLALLQNICLLDLCPLGEQETAAFFWRKLGGSDKVDIDIKEVYRRTSGTLLLLEDVVQNIREGHADTFAMRDPSLRKLAELFSSLSVEEYECMELLSVFENGVELETLSIIADKRVIALIGAVDKLYQRRIACEADFEGHLVVKIRIRMIRDVVYGRMSRLRKVGIHKLAALHYEAGRPENLKDYFCLTELKYHFSRAGCPYEHIYYAMRELWYRLDYCDEFFPNISNSQELLSTFYMSKNETYREFQEYFERLELMGDSLPSEQICELRMMYDFLFGRTLIRDSKGGEGMEYIRRLISMAQKLERDDMLLKGYLETIYHGIKTENEPLMRKYIEKARGIRNFALYESEKGILFRLEALCDIMIGLYDRAETLLFQSIEVLESPKLRSYSYINVAGAYDYLGIIYRRQRKFDRSREYLEKAAQMCLEKNVKKSLDIFYEDLGYTLFLSGNYAEAKKSFAASAEIYNMFGTCWMRSIGESCMAVISLREQDHEKALEYYRRAEIFSRNDRTKEELEVLRMARKELKRQKVI